MKRAAHRATLAGWLTFIVMVYLARALAPDVKAADVLLSIGLITAAVACTVFLCYLKRGKSIDRKLQSYIGANRPNP